jgi:uncharacterized protein (TIGR02996 family)
MPTLADLNQAVINSPVEDAPRLAYAAAADAAKDPRGAFIRMQIKHLDQRGSPPLAERQQIDEWVARFGPAWAGPVASMVDRSWFERGFAGHVRLSAAKFLASGQRLYAAAPVLHLDLTQAKAVFAELCASPLLSRIRSLHLQENDLDDESMRALAASTQLRELRWLSLAFNKVDTFGVELLASSKNFPRLKYVSLAANPCNPGERVADDQGYIVDRWLPPEGEQLEARHGHIPWLHVPEAQTSLDLPPDRFVTARR